MGTVAFFLGSMLAHTISCFVIGFIHNVTFIPYDSNTTTINVNESCTACGCYAKQNNYSGFNCFTNNRTCSIFPTYSVKYGLNTTVDATFYFLQLPPIGKRRREKESIKVETFLFYFQKKNLTFKLLQLNRASIEI